MIDFHLDIDPMACAFSEATHVITEVSYGFNSYFVFEKSVSNLTSKREVEGKTYILIYSILLMINQLF